MCTLGYNINQLKGVWVMNNNFINALQNILLDDSNNNLISGIDGMGAHASIFIDDEPTRRWLGFEFDGKPQEIFSYDLVRKLFDMSQKEFEQELPKKIRTRAEKSALMKAIDELELNDYRKIIFSSKYAENHF